MNVCRRCFRKPATLTDPSGQHCFECLMAVQGMSEVVSGAFVSVKGEPLLSVQPETLPLSDIDAQVLDYDSLMQVPDPEPLIKNVLDMDSAAMLFAPPGGFKSFLAVDWACHVATGRDWMGQRVRKGAVFYIAGEGARGIRKRVAAWAKRYDQEPRDLFVLPVAVPAVANLAEFGTKLGTSPEWFKVIASARKRGPVLVILDTLHRLTGEADENSARDMGAWIAAADQLKVATGACVLTVHHSGKAAGADERGSSSLRGAQDTMWRIDRRLDEMSAILRCVKSKDGEGGGFFAVSMYPVDLGVDAFGDPVNSLVVTEAASRSTGTSYMDAVRAADREALLPENARQVINALRGQDEPATDFSVGGCTGPKILDAVNRFRAESKQPPMPKANFYRVLSNLQMPCDKSKPDSPPWIFKVKDKYTGRDPALGMSLMYDDASLTGEWDSDFDSRFLLDQYQQ